MYSKVRHEVDDKVEGDRIENLVRHVGDHGSDGLGTRVIECVASLFVDDGTLRRENRSFLSKKRQKDKGRQRTWA
jgi:hypothetical protein